MDFCSSTNSENICTHEVTQVLHSLKKTTDVYYSSYTRCLVWGSAKIGPYDAEPDYEGEKNIDKLFFGAENSTFYFTLNKKLLFAVKLFLIKQFFE